MKKQYDFSRALENPYAQRIERSVTIRLDQDTIAYFQELSRESEVPYQTLIDLYLRGCASSGKRLELDWKPGPKRGAA